MNYHSSECNLQTQRDAFTSNPQVNTVAVLSDYPQTSQVIHCKLPLLPQSEEERNRGVQTTTCPTSQIFTPSGIGGDGSHVILSPLRVQGISCKPNSVSNHFQPCNSVNIMSKMSSFMQSILFIERRSLISAVEFRNESPITSTWSNVLHYCKCAPLSKASSLAAISIETCLQCHWVTHSYKIPDNKTLNV